MSWYEAFRAQCPVLATHAYLNAGAVGPQPLCSAEALKSEEDYGLTRGRGDFSDFERVLNTRKRVRALLARLLCAADDEIALTHHTTEAVNAVLCSIAWQSDDEIVTTNLEHDAVMIPLGLLQQRHKLRVRITDIGDGSRALAGLSRTIGNKTRLVILSHTVFSTGATLPVADIAKLCQQAGCWLFVDGAQTAGVMPLSMVELGVDFYTVSGQKWLCGPEGCGALFVRRAVAEQLVPGCSGYFGVQGHDCRGQVTLRQGAIRFETGMLHRPSLAAFEASLRWVIEQATISRVWKRSRLLADRCRKALETLPALRVITPAAAPSQLISFVLAQGSRASYRALVRQLARQMGVICRSIDHPPYALRASCGFFNDDSDIEALRSGLSDLL